MSLERFPARRFSKANPGRVWFGAIAVTALVTLTGVGAMAETLPGSGEKMVMVQLVDGTWESRSIPDNLLSAQQLESDPQVISVAEVRTYQHFLSAPPDDPAFPDQWHLTRNQASRSWQYADGSGVLVAVIDTGITAVSDLSCHSWVDPWDFVDSDAVPEDWDGHGTMVAQVVAECTDNGSFGASVAPGADLMPLRVFDTDGSATSATLYPAIMWAVDNGADVINLSLGYTCLAPYPACSDPAIESALAAAADAGVLVVAATGNDGGPLAYPANNPTTIAVGASTREGDVAFYSSRGSGIDLVAPVGDELESGGGVLQQGYLGGLSLGFGTSFSAPQVSGALALMLSAGASPTGAVQALLAKAADIAGSGYDTTSGYGDLRIRYALGYGTVAAAPPVGTTVTHRTGDVNGDGRADSLVFDRGFGNWFGLVSTGSVFSPSIWADFATSTGWGSQVVGDFSGDGKDDIANYYPANGTWWVSKSTGGGFSTSLWADFATSSGWKTHVVGDFDGDDKDDIANFHPSNGTWWVSRSTGSGLTTSLWADYSAASGWSTQVVGDFNGDGLDDIANFHPSNGTWWVSRSTGSGFTTSLWADYSAASGWSTQVVGDFNGDGLDDIANYYPGNGTWWVSKSSGTGFITNKWATFNTASGWSRQVAGDFNGDAKDDIANYYPGNGTWWVSKSSGTGFGTNLWADFTTTSGWTSHLVGDFTGDGLDDLVNAHSNGTWWVSKSNGSTFLTTAWAD